LPSPSNSRSRATACDAKRSCHDLANRHRPDLGMGLRVLDHPVRMLGVA
jgi:hypothetical protein